MTCETEHPGVDGWRCEACGAVFFPRRLLCARCHHGGFAPHRFHEGRVEEITTIRHVLGQTGWAPRRLANVTTPEGVSLTVGLLDGAQEGDAITLVQDGTAPFGRLKAGAGA